MAVTECIKVEGFVVYEPWTSERLWDGEQFRGLVSTACTDSSDDELLEALNRP